MKRIAWILALSLVLSLSLPALAAQDAALVTANGSATVSLMADTATIQIGASTRKPSVREAQEINDGIMNAVLEALINAGIPKEDIATSMYNVSASQYDPYGTPEERRLQYEVSNILYVTIRDMTKLSAAIEAATAAGANSIYGLSFSSSKNQEAYDRALTRAVEDAARKAAVLAKALGRELGDLVSIGNEQTFAGGYGVSNSMEMLDKQDVRAMIVSGDASVSANITATYKLK